MEELFIYVENFGIKYKILWETSIFIRTKRTTFFLEKKNYFFYFQYIYNVSIQIKGISIYVIMRIFAR